VKILRTGTKVGASIDMGKVAAGMARPGMDTRVWFAEGIVATIGDDGLVDDANPNAVISSPEGREADIVLLPELEHHTTCRIPSGGPDSTEDWPISPGDHVAVAFPGGNPGAGAILLAVLNSAADRLPTEGGQPMFKHDRRLIWTRSVPIDLRAGSGDGRVTLTQEGEVQLGGPDADQAVPLGDRMAGDIDAAMFADLTDSLLIAFSLLKVIAVGPFAAFQPAATAGFNAMTKLSRHGSWLSSVSKTK
jgi:hypothetical protein